MSRHGFYDDDGFVKDEWNEPSPWARQKTKYKVGDKVRILDGSNIKHYCGKWVFGMSQYIGETHEIIGIDDYDEPLGYRLKDVGFLWDERGLELVKPEAAKKIIIITNGKTTTARLYNGKTLEKETVAKCHPDDEFNFETGAGFALSRLFEPEYYTGKVVCCKAWSGPWTVGKIYPIVDGIIHNDNGQDIDEIKSVEHLNSEFISATFIELVEE